MSENILNRLMKSKELRTSPYLGKKALQMCQNSEHTTHSRDLANSNAHTLLDGGLNTPGDITALAASVHSLLGSLPSKLNYGLTAPAVTTLESGLQQRENSSSRCKSHHKMSMRHGEPQDPRLTIQYVLQDISMTISVSTVRPLFPRPNIP